MHSRAWFRSIRHPRVLRRAAIGLGAIAVAAAVVHGGMVAQTPANSQPASTFDDPIAAALCLAGQGCAGPASPSSSFESRPPAQQAICAAEETIKSAPLKLKNEVLAFSRSDLVAPCRQAALALAPKRDTFMAAVENRPPTSLEQAPPTSLEQAYVKAADDFAAACFTQRRILNHGTITPAERTFLREHVGLIVERPKPTAAGLKPVCEAARLSRFVITPEHCIPAAIRAQAKLGSDLDEIGFRFFDHPAVFEMKLRKLGTGTDPKNDPPRDFAILEIIGAPELDEAVEPLMGTMQLFDDFVVATTSVNLSVMHKLNNGLALDFGTAVQIRSNTICRPAHVTRDGIFLHTCFPEGIINAGAPFFQRQRGQLVFVGFQNGKTSSLPDPTLAACTRGLPNFGVAISARTLTQAMVR